MDVEAVRAESPKMSSCQAEERPSSPVNDCAICLEQLTDKSFTNSCLHMFCFHCLKAWSKVKPECPLCKQDFCSIIHNIRSMDDYDQYHVPPAPLRFAAPDSSSFFAQSLTRDALNLPFRDLLRPRDFFSSNRQFFSYRTTYIPGSFNVPSERSSRLVIQPYVNSLEIQNSYPSLSSSSSTHLPNLSNRKDVYLKELELRPSTDGRHRLSSPQFYRENEGQLHRLGRWLNRELVAISQLGVLFEAATVTALIMDMLPVHDIQSTRFHNALVPHFGMRYARRFVKEFYNFAISPYDIEEYDRKSVYTRQRTGSSLAFIVTVGSEESEDVQVIPSPATNHSTVRPWIDYAQLPSSTYPSSVLDPSRLASSTSTCPHLFSSSAPQPSTSQQVIDISDSENDDCVIIDEVKTSPQTIVLDDSDVEIPPAPQSPIPSTSGYLPPPKSKPDEKCTLFMPSTSKYVFENSTKIFPKNVRKRSPSCSSVISTDGSIIDQEPEPEPVPKPEPKPKKRKHQLKSRKTYVRRESFDYFSSSEFSEMDDSNDEDWQETPKKKKKPRKRSETKPEKKTRKRKKTERCKSPKRKKCVTSESTHKSSKRVSKSHKSKKSSKSTLESGPLCSSKSTNESAFDFDLPNCNGESSFSPIRPKLRSVVKKVERYDHFEDSLPSTSYGFRINDSQYQLTARRALYSSDSD